MSDPLGMVWDALEVGGYGPHGQPHDFRARCPGHDGDNATSLHVARGTGGGARLVLRARLLDRGDHRTARPPDARPVPASIPATRAGDCSRPA